jgi:predicted transcriptional regulator
MPATRLSFSYPYELKEKIQKIADKEDRPLSRMVRIFIKEGLEKRGVSVEAEAKKKSKFKKRS